MTEKITSGEILHVIWKMEKVAIDFHGKKLSVKDFLKTFLNVMLELVLLLLNLKVQSERSK